MIRRIRRGLMGFIKRWHGEWNKIQDKKFDTQFECVRQELRRMSEERKTGMMTDDLVKKVMNDNPDLTTDAELKEAISQEIMRKYRIKNLRDFGVHEWQR